MEYSNSRATVSTISTWGNTFLMVFDASQRVVNSTEPSLEFSIVLRSLAFWPTLSLKRHPDSGVPTACSHTSVVASALTLTPSILRLLMQR